MVCRCLFNSKFTRVETVTLGGCFLCFTYCLCSKKKEKSVNLKHIERYGVNRRILMWLDEVIQREPIEHERVDRFKRRKKRRTERERETPNGWKRTVISAAAIKPLYNTSLPPDKTFKTGKRLENRSHPES